MWKDKRVLMTIESRKASTDAHKHTSLHTHSQNRRPCITIPLCGFWNQQLHIWKFLEPLGSHGNIAVAGLQLHSWGHSRSFQRAQPDGAQEESGEIFTTFLLLYLYSTQTVCVMWRSVSVADLRTAPVRKLTFSVTRLRICSRSCRMLRGRMKRNGGHRRSPLRKTLNRKDRKYFV